MPSCLNEAAGDRRLGGVIEKAARRNRVQRRQRQVGVDAEIEDDAVAAPILGEVRDALGDRLLGRARANRPTVEPNRAAVERLEAEEDARQLSASRADEPGEADDFAASNGEARRRERRRRVT